MLLDLQALKNNVLKDFLHVAGPYGVTHLLLLSKSEISANLVVEWQTDSLRQLLIVTENMSTTSRPHNYIPYTISE